LFAIACSGTEPRAIGGTGGAGGSLPTVTELCERECVALHPAGELDYRATRSCLLCSACYDVCEADGVDLSMCPDELEAPNGCSAFHTTCSACVSGSCALKEGPTSASHSGLCAVQADNCSNNTACVAFTSCVSECVENTPDL
jgi:hypothetical protein